MTKQANPPKTEMFCDGHDIFIICDGLRIAKRGYPGTPQARKWVSLEPGYTVLDGPNYKYIEVEYRNPEVN